LACPGGLELSVLYVESEWRDWITAESGQLPVGRVMGKERKSKGKEKAKNY